jgi:hypothetical protein
MRRLKQNSGWGTKGKRSYGWEDNIKNGLLETVWVCELDWFRILPVAGFGNNNEIFNSVGGRNF